MIVGHAHAYLLPPGSSDSLPSCEWTVLWLDTLQSWSVWYLEMFRMGTYLRRHIIRPCGFWIQNSSIRGFCAKAGPGNHVWLFRERAEQADRHAANTCSPETNVCLTNASAAPQHPTLVNFWECKQCVKTVLLVNYVLRWLTGTRKAWNLIRHHVTI